MIGLDMDNISIMSLEFEALRLSSWGLAVTLVWLIWSRLIDHTLKNELIHENVRGHSPMNSVICSGLLGGMVLLTFTPPIFRDYMVWLESVGKMNTLLAFPCLIALQLIFIDRLAYDRTKKFMWCMGWILLSHVAKWGSAWLMVPQ